MIGVLQRQRGGVFLIDDEGRYKILNINKLKHKYMERINKGDIVILKSGSPKMTVEVINRWDANKGIYDEEWIRCTWFQGDELFSEYFNIDALEKVT